MRIPSTLTGLVVAPDDPAYHLARTDYNSRFAPFSPSYIVYPKTSDDVGRALMWARRYRIPFRVRSGGHSYEAYSLLNGGLVIDLSLINHIYQSQSTGFWHIGAGARLLNVYQTLWDKANVTIPGGSCPSVGLSGLTLGGGYGLIARQHGLCIDALVAVTMVDAQGRTLVSSLDQHADLFWALRGAGANNFGVVTELVFCAVPVGLVTIFSITWPWSHLAAVIQAFQCWADPSGLDHRITSILTLPARSHGYIRLVGQFLGTPAQLQPMLRPLLEIPDHSEIVQVKSYIEAVRHFAGLGSDPERWLAQGVPNHDTFKNTSAYAHHMLPGSAIAAIAQALNDTPGPASLVQLGQMGGRIGEIRPEDTAFYHRRARFDLQYQAYWTDPTQAESHIRWVEDFRQRMSPWTVGAYVNYCDARIEDWPRAYYGKNLDRLMHVKRRWDPRLVFRYPQGLSQIMAPGCHLEDASSFWTDALPTAWPTEVKSQWTMGPWL